MPNADEHKRIFHCEKLVQGGLLEVVYFLPKDLDCEDRIIMSARGN